MAGFYVEENIGRYRIQVLFLSKAFSSSLLVIVVTLQLGRVALDATSFDMVSS